MTKIKKIITSTIVSILVLLFIFSFFFFSTDMKVGSAPPISRNSIDQLLKRMKFGTIAFNAPSRMNINDSAQIQLLLSLTETIDKLKQAIMEEGEKIGATVKVSNRMDARITGYKFQIIPITPGIQAVSRNQKTEWKWEIHPKEEGTHNLHLTLSALLEIDGYNTPRTIRTFDRKINITIAKTQKLTNFFKNNWQWLWAAILVPIVGWLWNKKRKKANK